MILKRFGIALFFVLLFASPVMADSPTVSSIAKQLICPWNMVLADCTNPDHRGPMIALIEQKLAQGQSETEIIQFFVAQYGEQVLATPPKKGFNLMAWMTPFVAILAGAAVIALVLRTWVKRGHQAQVTTTVETGDGEAEYRRRVEQDLARFTERGFR